MCDRHKLSVFVKRFVHQILWLNSFNYLLQNWLKFLCTSFYLYQGPKQLNHITCIALELKQKLLWEARHLHDDSFAHFLGLGGALKLDQVAKCASKLLFRYRICVCTESGDHFCNNLRL